MTTTRSLLLVAAIAMPSIASADTIGRDPNDYGKVTHIGKGVWEIDLGALGVLSYVSEGGASATEITTSTAASLHYFLRDNLSVGVEGLVDYASSGGGNNSLTFGGAVDAAVHLRLGLGAFFRPGIALGGTFGNRDIPMMGGTIEQASQVAFLARFQLPIAYFASPRVLLQAGPEIDVISGSYTPMNADSISFTRVAGGFAVGVGYAF